MIEVRGLHVCVGAFTLRDITFVVPAEARALVVGPAGAGKTTLLETIAGVTPVEQGTVSLMRRDVTTLPPERRHVGLVYQHSYLFPHLTVGENISYGAPDLYEARQLAQRLDIDPLWTRDVRGLSGGERQLVALARAVARRPSVLLLDEPYAALDPRRRAQVRETMRALYRERALTVLQATHEAGDDDDAAVVCELDNGGMVASAVANARHAS